LTGNTYTTGPITANCTVTANFGLEVTSFKLIDPTPGASDNFGEFVVILGNGNIVVTDPNDSSVATNNGAVHLYNPITQTRIASFYADNSNDGQKINITVLGNSNFVIGLSRDDVGGIIDAGSVRLINGSTGVQIGATIAGDVNGDQLGVSSGITALGNNNFVIATRTDDEGGITDAGSVRLVDGSTGAQVGAAITGAVSFDFDTIVIIPSTTGLYYILAAPEADNGMVDSGLVRLIAP